MNDCKSLRGRWGRWLAMVLAGFGFSIARAADAPQGGPIAFRETTAESGLKAYVDGAFNHAIAWGDFDGDGRVDLFLGNFTDHAPTPKSGLAEAPRHGLFRQSGAGRFERVSMPSIERNGRCSGALWVDLDNDGDLDLVVTNNTHPPADPNRPAGRKAAANVAPKPGRTEPTVIYRNDNGKLIDVSKDAGILPADLYFARDVIALDYDGDGLLDLLICEDKVFRPQAHTRLLHNLGNFRFEDVTARAGLSPDLDAFAAAVADLNGDGRPDIYFTSCNRLYLSRGDGTYREAESLREVLAYKPVDAEDYTCGAVFADVDNDGDMDLLTGTHFMPARIRLFINDGLKDGVPVFRNVTKEAGLPELPNKAPTCDVADLDNDGWPDLYWSAWFMEGKENELRRPFVCRGLGTGGGVAKFDVPGVAGLPLNRKNTSTPGQRGMVYYVNGPAVDYDGDGRLDFLAGIWPDENTRLFHNESPANQNHWLEVRVAGDGKAINRMGVGAKVRIKADGKLIGYREIGTCGGYSGSRPAVVHFGLGARTAVDVEVEIPGRREPIVLKNPTLDRMMTVEIKP